MFLLKLKNDFSLLMIALFFTVFSSHSLAYENFNKEQLTQQIEQIGTDASLSEEQKKAQLSKINEALNLLNDETKLNQEIQSFNREKSNSKYTLNTLSDKLETITHQVNEGVPEITITDTNQLESLINDLTVKQKEAQSNLANANSDYNSLQTFPSRTQSTISENTVAIQKFTQELTDTASLSALDIFIKEKNIDLLNKEISLLQNKSRYLTELQDIATYKIRISTLQNQYYQDYLRQAQNLQNKLISQEIINSEITSDTKNNEHPLIQKELETNNQISLYIDRQLQQNIQLTRELSSVESALEVVKQINKDLKDQLNQIDGNLVLSRLLNRQQEEIPNIDISFNLDEILPNLNLWLYDLRNYRDRLFDTKSFVQNMIATNPELAPFKTDLGKIIKHRRDLYDKLYQEISEASTNATALKLKYTEYSTLKTKVSEEINEHLFWLKSNYPLGPDFLSSFFSLASTQLHNFIAGFNNLTINPITILPLTLLCLPFIIAYLIIGILKNIIVNFDNRLASYLDKNNDNLYVTPLAIVCQLLYAIPKTAVSVLIGALVALFTLSTPNFQTQAVAMLALHAIFFAFFISVLSVNSLAQRHFAMPPKDAIKLCSLLKHTFAAVFPILVITNIREIEPVNITNDTIGYTIVLLSNLYLIVKLFQYIKNSFAHKDFSLVDYLKSLLLIAIPIAFFIMIALGYYYTAIKLINRIAFSFYLFLGYKLISHLVRRELFVIETKLVKAARLQSLKEKEESDKAPGFALVQRKDKIEQLRFEFINSKAFKLINIVLLCTVLTILYLLWKDLTSVLSYLNTVTLWSSTTIVNGQEEVTSTLTLANIFSAAVIIFVTVILYRNLPPVLERIFMLRLTSTHKSTSYTARILTSYIITALGLILSAGALGLSWDKLQWLIAALSVGLGFGLQEIFANFVSGIIILFERQIRVGDIITINSLSGTVNKIRIRATTVISFDNKEVVIPNREFITTELTNWSLSNTITKLEFMVGVDYNTDLDEAKTILEDIVMRCPYLSRDNPPRIYVKSLDASSIGIVAEVFVEKIGDRKTTLDYLNINTIKRFNAANINIPFNRLDVTLLNTNTGNEVKVSD